MRVVKEYLNALNDRDRFLFYFIVVILVIYCIYMFVYAPLSESLERQTAQLVEKQETLAWMKKVQSHYKPAADKRKISNGQLLSLLARELKVAPVKNYTYKLEQTTSGEVQLSFVEVPFNAFMNWFKGLSGGYGIEVKQLEVDKTGTAGVVKLTVFLAAA